jgi:hypothetical protein
VAYDVWRTLSPWARRGSRQQAVPPVGPAAVDLAVRPPTAVDHDGRRELRRLVVKSDKFQNGRIILQNE